MGSVEETIFCDGCGVEITWSPVIVHPSGKGLAAYAKKPRRYCCLACAKGLPCHCAERMELEDERRLSSLPLVNGV